MAFIEVAGAAGGRVAAAQMPGAPVLQSAWAIPGHAASGTGSGGGASYTFALTDAWGSDSGRVAITASAGWQTGATISHSGLGGSASVPSRLVYGARIALPLVKIGGAAGQFGLAAFAGVGGGQAAQGPPVIPSPGGGATSDSVSMTAEVPIGFAMGWRHVAADGESLALYASPSLVYVAGGRRSNELLRAAFGADVGLTPMLGVTAGVEVGGKRDEQLGGPSGVLFILGCSLSLGRR